MIFENRPYIVCHMTTSINGKITGHYLNETSAVDEYYRIHKEFDADAFLCGRITMESSFTHGYYPDLKKYHGMKIERVDYVPALHDFYAVAIDFHGRLGWIDNHIEDEDPGYDNAYIIEVLSENVSDAYLAYLQEKNIAYIFAGKDVLNLPLAMSKLKKLFHIDFLLLEGGGIVDGSFLKDNLVDELSLVVAPYIEYSNDMKELFNHEGLLFQKYHLDTITKLQDNTIYLRYKK